MDCFASTALRGCNCTHALKSLLISTAAAQQATSYSDSDTTERQACVFMLQAYRRGTAEKRHTTPRHSTALTQQQYTVSPQHRYRSLLHCYHHHRRPRFHELPAGRAPVFHPSIRTARDGAPKRHKPSRDFLLASQLFVHHERSPATLISLVTARMAGVPF